MKVNHPWNDQGRLLSYNLYLLITELNHKHFASSLYKNEWIQGANWWSPGQAGGVEGWDEIGDGD